MSIVCVGELLLDQWPDGSVRPGGAPANVAFHACALGARVVLISRLGNDEAGASLRRWVQAAGIAGDFLQSEPQAPTGMVRVRTVAPDRPDYDILTPAAWDFLEATDAALAAARQAGVFVFGTLAQRHTAGRRAVRLLAEAARGGNAHLLADLNLRAPFHDGEILLWTLRTCGILKLNREELAEVSRVLGARGCERDLFTGLLREFGIPRGVLTSGDAGAWIYEDGRLFHEPAAAATAVDPVGAGDAFSAVLAAGLAAGRSLRESAPRAARAAAFVVSRHGATPPLPPRL